MSVELRATPPLAAAVPGVDLAALASGVPDAVIDRIRGAHRVLAVGHENPDADTVGATLAVCRIVELLGGTADPVCTDPVPPLY